MSFLSSSLNPELSIKNISCCPNLPSFPTVSNVCTSVFSISIKTQGFELINALHNLLFSEPFHQMQLKYFWICHFIIDI